MARLADGTKIGNCVIEHYISDGLSGNVYKACYRDRIPVALKIFDDEKTSDRTVRSYFLNEQMLIREVTNDRQHPHIVKYVTSQEANPYIYLATEYLEGAQSLEQVLNEPLTPGFALYIIEKLASALDYLHYGNEKYSPIIHRDVKPHNILIGPHNEVILIDFSIARFPAFGVEDERSLGTVQYMPPEQYENKETPASDLFALAVLALQLLTRHSLLPSDKYDARTQLAKLRDTDYADVRAILDKQLHTADVFVKALQYLPEQRYASCEEFAYELRQALIADGINVASPRQPRKLPRQYMDYGIIAIIGLIALTLLASAWGWL